MSVYYTPPTNANVDEVVIGLGQSPLAKYVYGFL